jgi:predicted ABC-type exoprotein transport system permease subunit
VLVSLLLLLLLLLPAFSSVGALVGVLVSLLLLLLLYHSHDDALCGNRTKQCRSSINAEKSADSSSIHETTYLFLVLTVGMFGVVPSIIAPPAPDAPASLGKRNLIAN